MRYIIIICLACSRKMGGKCIAGKTLNKKRWIRPVNEKGPLEDYQIRYSDGELPKLLDIIKITIVKSCPNKYQPENYLISDEVWEKIGEYEKINLDKLCDDYSTIFDNVSSTNLGLFDKIPANHFGNIDNRYSLMFIKIKTIKFVRVNIYSQGYYKKKLRAKFDYKGIPYNISITDENIEKEYCKLEEGEYNSKNSQFYLCLSMGSPWGKDNNCYKFVASIIKS